MSRKKEAQGRTGCRSDAYTSYIIHHHLNQVPMSSTASHSAHLEMGQGQLVAIHTVPYIHASNSPEGRGVCEFGIRSLRCLVGCSPGPVGAHGPCKARTPVTYGSG